MTVPEPTSQQKALKRVLAVSWIDGWSLVIIASLSFLLTVVLGQLLGVIISLLIFTAGLIELRGRRALKKHDADSGMKLLVRSQFLLLTVILVYCARSIGSFDEGYLKTEVVPLVNDILSSFLGISLDDFMQQSGLTIDEIMALTHKAFLLAYGIVAFLSIIYQGGLILYYRGKTKLVTEALAVPILPPVNPPLA